jgi:hypothetical protein
MVQIAIPAPGVRPESQEFAELTLEEEHAGQRTRLPGAAARAPQLDKGPRASMCSALSVEQIVGCPDIGSD